jgi:hypothetical protein
LKPKLAPDAVASVVATPGVPVATTAKRMMGSMDSNAMTRPFQGSAAG